MEQFWPHFAPLAPRPDCPPLFAPLALSSQAHQQLGRWLVEVVVSMREVCSEAEEWPHDWEQLANVFGYAIVWWRHLQTSAVSLP